MTDTAEEVQRHSSQERSYTRPKGGRDVCEELEPWEFVEELLGPAAARPADCGSPVTRPPWLDEDKLKRGQAVFHRHFNSVFASNLLGLLCLLALHSILKVLRFTGRSSTPAASFRRYLGTLNHVRLWYSSDVFDPNSSGHKSLQLVRRMHTVTHTQAQEAGLALVSQADMVVTQWAFFGLVLTHGKHLGVNCSKDEEESLVHFWKAVGYLLGIEDRYNLCSGKLEGVRARCRAVLQAVVVAGLSSPPAYFPTMADSMLQGVHMIVPVMDPPAFMAFTHHLLGLHHDTKNLSWYSTFMLNYMVWNFETILHIPVLGQLSRVCQNNLLCFALYVCNSLPAVASYCRWVENNVSSTLDYLKALSTRALKGLLLLLNLQKAK